MYTMAVILHVLGATVWTGGHLVLSLTVLPRALRRGDPSIVHEFESGYEKIGIPALVVQVVTGLYLAHVRLPDVGAWFRLDAYPNHHVLAKLVLLAATVGLALHARLRVLPGLDRERLTALAWHVVPVTVLSVLFVIVGVGLRVGRVF